MATTLAEPLLHGELGSNTRGILRIVILVLIAAAAIASRLFSVIRKSIDGTVSPGAGYVEKEVLMKLQVSRASSMNVRIDSHTDDGIDTSANNS